MYTLCVVLFILLFFFSSRRRHTRCLSDWSSDVCSSDLRPFGWPGPSSNARGTNAAIRAGHRRCRFRATAPVRLQLQSFRQRSEERRVGKECRSRWSPCDQKKKESETQKVNQR